MKALIVVDMQNDFIDGALGTEEAKKIIPKAVEEIKNFDGDIYYTRDTHYKDYLDTMEGKKLPVIHCIKNTFGWQINDLIWEAGKGKRVYVYDKFTFACDTLADRMKEKNYEIIELIGLCTDICVISNALSIKSKVWETPIIVNSMCCAGVTPNSHKNALEAMKMCQIDII